MKTYIQFLPLLGWALAAFADGKLDDKDLDSLLPMVVGLILLFSSDNKKIIQYMVKVAQAVIAANPSGGTVA
jgi:hypothetical protein